MDKDIKRKVKAYYGNIAKKVDENTKCSCGCGTSCCSDAIDNSNLYTSEYIADLPAEAVNASLGCANPITFAVLKEGEIALDLGSGGGIDVFIASKYVGESGKVYGLDMTDEMLSLANKNKAKMGIENVEFIKGYIEDIPMKDNAIDVILSNCVINLCEDKEKALGEAYRVLKPGGRLAIADVVMLKNVPEDIKQSAEMWIGCIAGALPVDEYIEILKKVGFRNIEIEPVNIYTKEIIDSIVDQKNLKNLYDNIDKELVDGAFAGTYVKAVK